LDEILYADPRFFSLAYPDLRIHNPDENMLMEKFMRVIGMNRILLEEIEGNDTCENNVI
jgi:hypothetical protein